GFGKEAVSDRFFRPRDTMQEGDRFIPLMQGDKDGYTGVGVALFDYDSDMKGAVIVSGIREAMMRGASEDEQARLAARTALMLLRLGVAKVFTYEFHAPEEDDLDLESHFGIVHNDLAPKPAFHAYKTLVAQRPAGSTIIDTPWQNADASLYFPQWQTPDGTHGGAVWAYRRPGTYTLAFSTPDITLVSHLGEPVAAAWHGNACRLPLTDAPVYFRGGTLLTLSP
ncbi:MAG: hypothetical protein FWF84_05815, partial [Kiritimatiellaeota bacterium]|nr:hypothetical protein [Kiritimatiellota bacterium]